MLWKNFFDTIFTYSLEEALFVKENVTKLNATSYNITNIERISEAYTSLIESSCKLLQYYLRYQGLFQFSDREIIKEAFYVELITDGEKWINALTLLEIYQIKGYQNIIELILKYYQDENFKIFIDLQQKFLEISETYE